MIHVLINGGQGVFLPRTFGDCYGESWKVSKEHLEILSKGPDSIEYWETWDDVLSNATFVNEKGTWTLHQGESGDLFMIHADFNLEELP